LPQDNDPQFKNNQGVINGKIVQLYQKDKKKMREYAGTLTEGQRNIARSHLDTFLGINAAAEKRRRQNDINRRS